MSTKMSIRPKPMQNEIGNTLIAVVLALIVLALTGFSAISTTVIDTKITANNKFYKMAFYNADSGLFATPKLISETMLADELIPESELGSISYMERPAGDISDFHQQVYGYDEYDGGDPDIQYTLGDFAVRVDVEHIGAIALAGGGVEFATAAEGIANGSVGGLASSFVMNSTGTGPSNAVSRLSAGYCYVMDIPGG